ncbi:MAG: hypothetical protein LBF22_02575 [Deltaproteobacteria bacterium]|jgi:DNA-directed RNA polymerase subunit RPC12/RpoP|nr:hypothetical protein [Deltaproteobacteria bacterium]
MTFLKIVIPAIIALFVTRVIIGTGNVFVFVGIYVLASIPLAFLKNDEKSSQEVICPNCNTSVKVDSLGQEITCPQCNIKFKPPEVSKP